MYIALRTFNTLIFFSLFVLTLTYSNSGLAQPGAPQGAASGGELFIQYRCAACHTIGRGVFVGPDLKGVGDRYKREDIIRWIENPQLIYNETGRMPLNPGFPPMPPMQVPPQAAQLIADYVLTVEPDSVDTAGGAIKGRVLLGKEMTPKPGVGITVTPFMGDRPSGSPKTLISGDDGYFSFTELPWDRSYQIRVNYEGAEYSTDKMVFAPGETEKYLELPVFEPTPSDENIRINEAQLIVQVLEGKVTVADMSVFENTGDTVYVGGKELGEGKKESVRYSLPKEAGDIALIHGFDPESVVTTDTGFSDTTSVLPGPRRAVFTYTVPFDSGEAVIDRKILYPTSRFLLLILDSGEEFSVKGLTQEEPVTINNETFLKWSGEGLGVDNEIIIEVGSKGVSNGSYTTWAALGLLAIVILAGVFYAAVRKKDQTGDDEPEEEPKTSMKEESENLDQRRGALIKEIASLDDKYDAGDIAENEYKALRDSKKKEILDITRRIKSAQ